MAGDDLPDIMHIYNGYALAPNLPASIKAKCADLTPYLAGNTAKDYPYLANIPTYAWRNSVSALDGALYLIPIFYKHSRIKQYLKDYAERRIMPNSRSFEVKSMCSVRHNHSRSRNARTGSDGRYLPGVMSSGAVRCNARSLMARLACR